MLRIARAALPVLAALAGCHLLLDGQPNDSGGGGDGGDGGATTTNASSTSALVTSTATGMPGCSAMREVCEASCSARDGEEFAIDGSEICESSGEEFCVHLPNADATAERCADGLVLSAGELTGWWDQNHAIPPYVFREIEGGRSFVFATELSRRGSGDYSMAGIAVRDWGVVGAIQPMTTWLKFEYGYRGPEYRTNRMGLLLHGAIGDGTTPHAWALDLDVDTVGLAVCRTDSGELEFAYNADGAGWSPVAGAGGLPDLPGEARVGVTAGAFAPGGDVIATFDWLAIRVAVQSVDSGMCASYAQELQEAL